MAGERKRNQVCAIYTRKSSEEGLEQDFNSLDAQREACTAYIQSQRHEGWTIRDINYDDGGFSGGSLARPALQQLLSDIHHGKVDIVVVYKVDRLTRSLADFAKIVESFDQHGVSFVSVTQQFNTTSSMGRLTLNVLLSFAQFEREVTGERIRDKIAASRRKGMWMGGLVSLGYDGKDHKLSINQPEADTVRMIFRRYAAVGCVAKLKVELDQNGIASKIRVSQAGAHSGGRPFSRGALYALLQNRVYVGDAVHKDNTYPGAHEAIIDFPLWEQVQQTLSGNRRAHTSRDRSKEPSLLSGLLFDDNGNRFSPSHAIKHGKRYRYYVSQAVLQNHRHRANSAVRFPAHEIEQLVRLQLIALLADPTKVRAAAQKAEADCDDLSKLLTAAQRHAQSWPQDQPREVRNFIRGVVVRVVIETNHIEIRVSKTRLRAALLGDHSQKIEGKPEMTASNQDDLVVLRSEVRIRRCGLETKLIIPNAGPATNPGKPNGPMVKAIVRANLWQEKLLNERGMTVKQIAIDEKKTEPYVRRFLPLTSLAPDIVEAILDGRHPADLTLGRLTDEITLDWTKQRRAFGFTNGQPPSI